MHAEWMSILFFVVGALFLGTVVKTLMQKSRLPYTVVLLLVTMAIAGMDRYGIFGEGEIDHILHMVGAIDPHLILFLFLPTLIFESAYTMEAHLFMRIAPQIVVLAIVGLCISMLLTAAAMSWLLPIGLGAALLFGALISATDPVAVVALLKEKSSRKRLETLIEGESLLNDGTAIVFFSLFYGFAIGTVASIEPLGVIGEFLWVVCAGLLIGLGVGWGVLWMIGHLFNKPYVEISLSIVAAYAVYIIAETLHVSGVVALVALALLFSTYGKTRVSPEVSHFLHHFWEMMAFIANTLIFVIVGVVIVLTIPLDSPDMWFVLFVLYVVLMLIRSASIWVLMPVLERIGVGISRTKATVLVWGGLRGAVSLALALSIAQDSAFPKEIGEQILFLTAGIVVLTIVINGATMEWMLGVLGLDRLPPAKAASVHKATQNVYTEMTHFLQSFQGNPFFNRVSEQGLKTMVEQINRVDDEMVKKSDGIKVEELEIAFMRRLLEIERSSYWHQFEEGYIGRKATLELTGAAEEALDNEPVIAPRKALQSSWKVPVPPAWLNHIPFIQRHLKRWIFRRLSLSYDIARGFVVAQEEILKHLERLSPSPEATASVEAMVQLNTIEAMTFTETVGKRYPNLTASLQTESARRLLLNHERSLVMHMEEEGVLEEAEAKKLIEHLETQMAHLSEDEQPL